MNEENIDKLIKESLLHTSDDFTDQLMSRIETAAPVVTIPLWQYVVLTISFILLALVPFIVIKQMELSLTLLDVNLGLPFIPVQILGILFVLFAVNKLLILREEQKYGLNG